MSQEVFIRGIFASVMGLGFAWLVFSRYDSEIGSDSTETDRQKYLPYIPGSLLPGFLLVLTLLSLFQLGIGRTAEMVLSMCFPIFLHICLYYLVLMLLLPFLRKYISARACAMLWVIPNYLYITAQDAMELPSPLLVITAPGNLAWIVFSVWLAGFIAVLSWKIVEHLRFRMEVLRDSTAITDSEILSVWDSVIADSWIKKPKFKLLSSPHVSTPLTVGLFRRAIRVVLPKKEYTQEELQLILKHEIVHIGREDAWNKFFLVFCTAMCWFNPLMWIAMGKSAEDLELSCDETVLLNADEETRRQYANLLLDTAGDERGFTTCLSASANAMRYRLRSVTKPSKRYSGALIVGAIFFVLCMTSGYVALAFDADTGQVRIYQDDDTENYAQNYEVRSITMADDEFNRNFVVADEEAFHEYLSGLTLYKLTGNFSFSDSERSFTYLLDLPPGTLAIILHDHGVKVVPMFNREMESEYYYIPEGIDWDYLSTIVFEYPAMNTHLSEEGDSFGRDLGAILTKLWKVEDGERVLIHEETYPEGEHHGLFTREPFPYAAELIFTYELAAPCSVVIESWDYSESYTLSQTDLSGNFKIDLPNYPAHYTVYASLYGPNGDLYEAEFWFNIGDVDSN